MQIIYYNPPIYFCLFLMTFQTDLRRYWFNNFELKSPKIIYVLCTIIFVFICINAVLRWSMMQHIRKLFLLLIQLSYFSMKLDLLEDAFWFHILMQMYHFYQMDIFLILFFCFRVCNKKRKKIFNIKIKSWL